MFAFGFLLVSRPAVSGGVKSIDPKQLDLMLQANPQIQLLDVREDWEVRQGKISGSKHIPLGELEKRLQELDPQRPIIVYCRVGNRSARAAELLQSRGFVEVMHLKGGIEAYSVQRGL